MTKWDKLGNYIEKLNRPNSDLRYGIDDVCGITNTKQLVHGTKANLIGRTFEKFTILAPHEFIFNRRTSRNGERISLGFNATDREWILTEDYCHFRVRKDKENELDPEFLYLFFLNPEFDRYARFNSWGSATEFFNWEEIVETPVPILPISEQRKIVRDYQVITDRIELLQSINKVVLSTIQALRKNWLEDYVPFGGKRPLNWHEVALTDIANIVTGYSYSSEELVEFSDVSMATIKNFELGGGFRTSGYKALLPKKSIKTEQYCELFDTVVAHTDLTQGKIIGNAECILSFGNSTSVLISMDLVRVIPKVNGISKFFITAVLQDEKFKKHCLQYINGTTVMHLSKEALKQYKLFLPEDFSCFAKLNEALETCYRLLSINMTEIEILNKIKNNVMR